jgi:hypothetical protein
MRKNFSGSEFLIYRFGDSPVELDAIQNSFIGVDWWKLAVPPAAVFRLIVLTPP